MENNGVKRIRFSLRLKFILVILIIGVSITCAILGLGVFRYTASITRTYNNMAYQIAGSAADLFTEQELKEYAELAYRANMGEPVESEIERVIESDRYKEIKAHIQILRENMNANDIFVCVFNTDVLANFDREADERGEWTPLYYIMDCFPIEDEAFIMGDHSSVVEDFIEELIKSSETGIRTSDPFLAHTQFGYNTTAVYPVVQNGEVAAFVCVEIPVATLEEDIMQFLTGAVIAAGITAAILLVLGILFVVHTMIKPIVLIASEAESFVNNNNVISDKLDKIKTNDEIQLLSRNLMKMEIDINEYIENITKVTAEKERIGTELEVATQIQASMLPCIFPAFPERNEFDVFATMNPAKEVGGDFYDFFMVDERHIAIVVADVSGKGVPAALFMVIGKTLIKDHTQPGRDIGEVFTEVNELLCEANSEGMFITAFEGVLDLVTGEFTFANAGHEIPFICKKDGHFEPYKIKAGFVLAGMEGMRYKCGTMQLEPGDKIFQYTDGVTEATNKDNELYGMGRLEEILVKYSHLSPTDLLPKVKEDIDAFVGEAPQFDDITMLCMEYTQRAVEGEL